MNLSVLMIANGTTDVENVEFNPPDYFTMSDIDCEQLNKINNGLIIYCYSLQSQMSL